MLQLPLQCTLLCGDSTERRRPSVGTPFRVSSGRRCTERRPELTFSATLPGNQKHVHQQLEAQQRNSKAASTRVHHLLPLAPSRVVFLLPGSALRIFLIKASCLTIVFDRVPDANRHCGSWIVCQTRLFFFFFFFLMRLYRALTRYLYFDDQILLLGTGVLGTAWFRWSLLAFPAVAAGSHCDGAVRAGLDAGAAPSHLVTST